MFKQKIAISLLLFLFGLGGVLQAGELSFDQALEMLKRDNNELLAARAEEQQADYEKQAAGGLYFPKIGLEGKYTRIDEPIVLDLSDVRSALVQVTALTDGVNVNSVLPEFEMEVQDDTFLKYNINFSWPIYTGGKIQAVNRAANAKTVESREKTRGINASLVSKLVIRYYGVQLATEVVEVRRQVLDSMTEHLKQAKQQQESGMIAVSEQLHAAVAWAEADREYKKALRSLDINQAALNSILSSEEDIVPTSEMFILRDIDPMQSFLDHAESGNPFIKQVAARRKQAQEAYTIEKSAFYPSIYLFGTHELNKDDLTVLEPEWAVGIGFSYNLFSGFSSRNKLKAARQQNIQVEFLEKDVHHKIRTLVEKKYNELMQSLEQFEATETALTFATEYVRVRNKAFKSGMATSIDVVDSQLALSRVKIDKLNAAYRFDVALAELLEASGKSDQFDLYRNHENSQEL